MEQVERVLELWFADSREAPSRAQARMPRWFGADAELDAAVAEQAGLISRAARGELAHWRQSPAGALAEILVLDQFPRNLYRGEPAAFAHDEAAAAATMAALERGWVEELSIVEAGFALMPLQHAESTAAQQRALEQYGRLLNRAPGPWRGIAESFCHHARQHARIIERFGRFPHRNRVLDRPDTPAEARYLREEGSEYSAQVAKRS